MTLKDLKKLVSVASEQRGGWESYRAREKALGELLHYMPRLLEVAEKASTITRGHDDSGPRDYYAVPVIDLSELMDALTALEGK
jgi:hypothetical protein